jgi:hypothetical protein
MFDKVYIRALVLVLETWSYELTVLAVAPMGTIALDAHQIFVVITRLLILNSRQIVHDFFLNF